MVITTAQLHSTKTKLRFCTGSNSVHCSVSEICDGEDLWQWYRMEIGLNAFRPSTMPPKQFILIIIIIIIIISIIIIIWVPVSILRSFSWNIKSTWLFKKANLKCLVWSILWNDIHFVMISGCGVIIVSTPAPTSLEDGGGKRVFTIYQKGG